MKIKCINSKTSILFGLLFVLSGQIVYTQNNIEASERDSIFYTDIHSPQKAAMLSAVLPGLGQAYNRKYWKIPIIYAGFGGLIYAIDFNNDKYKFWRLVYADADMGIYNDDLLAENPNYSSISIERIANQAKIFKERYRRWRDMSIIGITAFYLLNIIDANVDGHFFNYDISKDLSLQIDPMVDNLYCLNSNILGIKCSFAF